MRSSATPNNYTYIHATAATTTNHSYYSNYSPTAPPTSSHNAYHHDAKNDYAGIFSTYRARARIPWRHPDQRRRHLLLFG
jgi:hypothetical protein